eukprot:1424234-Pyramimonas_sp.AAC.1
MTTKFAMDTMPSPQTLRRAMYATFLEQGWGGGGGPCTEGRAHSCDRAPVESTAAGETVNDISRRIDFTNPR